MGFGHADGQVAPALFLEVAQLAAGGGRPDGVRGAIDLLRQRQNLVLGRGVVGVQIVHFRIGGGGGHYGFGQGQGAGAALGVAVAFHGGVGPGAEGDVLDAGQFLGAVGAEPIDGHHGGQPEALDDADVMGQVGAAGGHLFRVGLGQVAAAGAAVPLQGARGYHQYGGGGGQVAVADLDVHELFEAQVGGEAGFGDDIIGVGQRHAVGDYGVAAVGDVAERPGVHQGGLAFQGLGQVGHYGLVQQGHQGAGEAQLIYADRSAAAGGADHDAAHAFPQVVQILGQGEDGHNFRCGDDAEAGFAQGAVAVAPNAGDDLPQAAVGGVGDPRPGDAVGVKVGQGAPEGGVVHQGGQEVVGGGDGVGVAGEVDVDFLLGDDAGSAAAGAAALDAENRAEGGFPEGDGDALAELPQALGEADGGGGFAFAGGRGGDAGYDHQLAPSGGGVLPGVQGDFGLVAAVGEDVVGGDAQLFGDVGDGLHFDSLN